MGDDVGDFLVTGRADGCVDGVGVDEAGTDVAVETSAGADGGVDVGVGAGVGGAVVDMGVVEEVDLLGFVKGEGGGGACLTVGSDGED